jgi:hypothetical protein
MSYHCVALLALDGPEQIEFKYVAELPTLSGGEVQVKVVLHCAD